MDDRVRHMERVQAVEKGREGGMREREREREEGRVIQTDSAREGKDRKKGG